MKSYRVYEYSYLRCELGREGHKDWFTPAHLDAMVDYHDNRGGSKYYRLVRSGVRFAQYVGVIQVLDITIEILPKTDREENSEIWHDVLLRMLRQTRFLKLDYVSEASLRYRKYSILHLYFAQYLREVDQLLQRGLMKRYRLNEGNVSSLKGALQFNKHLTQNLVHKERLLTRHQVYDPQHITNQVLYEALLVLKRLIGQSLLADELNRVLFRFPEMSRINVSESTFDRIRFDRKTEPYRKAIAIAKMILLNYSPDIKGGCNDLFALLFDMNDLWEEYIYRQLLKAGIKVKFQESARFWESRTMRPDMVVRNGEETLIVDAKWKVIDNAQPSNEDLRQIFAYNLFWKSSKGFLVYPKTSKSPETQPGEYDKYGITTIDKMTCQVVYVDVLDEDDKISQILPPLARP